MYINSITLNLTKVMLSYVLGVKVRSVQPMDACVRRFNAYLQKDIKKVLNCEVCSKRRKRRHNDIKSRASVITGILCERYFSRYKKGQFISNKDVATILFNVFKASIRSARKVRYRLPSQVMRASCARAVALRTFTPRASARQTHRQSTKHKDDSGGTGSDSDSASSNDLLLYYLIRIRPRPARHRAMCTSRKLESAAAMPHCPYKKEVQQS